MTLDMSSRPSPRTEATHPHDAAHVYTNILPPVADDSELDETRRAVRVAVSSTDWVQVAHRVIAEAIRWGIPVVADRRADALDAARPRPGDFTGAASAEELRRRDLQLAEDARRLRRHALVLRALLDENLDLPTEAERLGVAR